MATYARFLSMRRLTFFLLVSVAMSGSGCDQAGDVLNDVKSTVTGEPEAAVSENETTASDSVQDPPTASDDPTPQPVTAEEILSSFMKLAPHEISDGALTNVVSSTAAATRITELDLQGDSVSGEGLKQLRLMPNLSSLTINNGTMSTTELANIAQTELQHAQNNRGEVGAENFRIGKLGSR